MANLEAVHCFMTITVITILFLILYLRFTTANQWQQVLVKLSASQQCASASPDV